MQMGETIDKMRRRMPQPETIRRAGARVARVLRKLSPKHLFGRLDWYIIRKFIGTYIFSIVLIISIALVFDFNENLSKFTKYHAPWRAIVFDYYANFIPYYSNLFSPLFVFIAVIFFTSKLAGNSEIIAMLSSGVSFRRLMRPYMISCVLIASVTFYLNSFVIPHGTVIRQNFESLYRNSKKNTSAENVQLQVGKGTVAYIQHYDDRYKRGYGFSLDKFEGKKLVSHMTAMEIQYDTIADAKYHWKATNWKSAHAGRPARSGSSPATSRTRSSSWNPPTWSIPRASRRPSPRPSSSTTSPSRRAAVRAMSCSTRWSSTSASPCPSPPSSSPSSDSRSRRESEREEWASIRVSAWG